MSDIEKAKARAASVALNYLLEARVIGIGTGTTVGVLIEKLANDSRFKGKLFVPSSIDTALKLSKLGFNVLYPATISEIDVYVDSADEVDPNLNMIKGGGAALTQEKVLTYFSKRRIFIVDHRKLVSFLGTFSPVPIEVIPNAITMILTLLRKQGYKASLRLSSKGKYGPITSDNGGIIIDIYTGKIEDPEELDIRLKNIPGVIETGIFTRLADIVIVGYPDTVKILKSERRSS